MKNTDDLIKDFLYNRLSPAERKEVETRLDSDPMFRKEFNVHKAIHATLEKEIEADTRRFLKEELDDRPTPSRRIWPWVAGILTLIALALLLYGLKVKKEVKNMNYQQYALVDPYSFSLRGTTQENVNDFLASYHEKDMDRAAEQLNILEKQNYTRTADLQLLMAQLYWKNKDYNRADSLYALAATDPMAREKALLQKLYYLSKTNQKVQYHKLNAELQNLDNYSFEEERKQIENLRKSWFHKYFY